MRQRAEAAEWSLTAGRAGFEDQQRNLRTLRQLGLSGRTANCLSRSYSGPPITAELLRAIPDWDYLMVRDFGEKSLAAVRALFPYEEPAAGGRVMTRAHEGHDIHEVAVEYGRTVSDGNYGSERVGVVLTAHVDGDQETYLRVAHDLAISAKEIATAQLRQASSPVVRRAVIEKTSEVAYAPEEG